MTDRPARRRYGIGLHFFPLAPVLEDPALRPLGALLILVAAVAAVTGLLSSIMLSLIVGPGAGLCLLISGIATAISGRSSRRPRTGSAR